MAIVSGFAKRCLILFSARQYDFVFIHRETAPIGPPIIEYWLAKILGCRIIYDFDDAIWLTDRKKESLVMRMLKWRSKVSSICRWSYKVSCGNTFLQDYARQFNKQAVYNPTTIDTEHVHNPALYNTTRRAETNGITIGWTGSHSTLKYLEELVPVFEQLAADERNVEFLVIADHRPGFAVPALVFRPWQETTEIEDLLNIDIGVMPLPDDDWAQGKCGFKALQYMALKIPAVVSPVGVNTTILRHDVEGFHASTQQEWLTLLKELITNPAKRKSMGEKGRERVIHHYSVVANTGNFLDLFT